MTEYCKVCGLPIEIHKGMKHKIEGEGAIGLVPSNTPENTYKGPWGFDPCPI